jgi:glycerol-3-phosphate dehydrogenase (NAD(P)+)
MKITIIGAGSWGTTLAIVMANNAHNITLWVFEKDLAEEMIINRENNLYLPGHTIPDSIKVTNSLSEAVKDAEIIVNVVPTQYIRGVFSSLTGILKQGQIIVTASKGIEKNSLLTVTNILKNLFGDVHQYAVLSGPSFAKEVVKENPAAVSIAAYDKDIALMLQNVFSTPYFRIYRNCDVTGVELGGALKNVIAIASGISDGLGFGHNTRAALITRGLAEIVRLGIKIGAQPRTFSGLSGLGDLVLTCAGDLSRNRTVGLKLGQGMKLIEILESMHMVAEGVETTLSARKLAHKFDVEMPIVEQVYQVLYNEKDPHTAVTHLMMRAYKQEFDE